MDISITASPDGHPLAHHPDCPMVHEARAAGAPLMTLFEISCGLDGFECAKHSCLDLDTHQGGER